MNSYGTLFKITLYGESHSPSMGIVIENIKSGLKVDLDQIRSLLKERRPKEEYETTRIEEDQFEITSGVFNDYTTGNPIHVSILNKEQKSSDYLNLNLHFRPGHADFVAHRKYNGFQDYRGGGAFSGRTTALLVVAGYFSSLVKKFDIETKIIQLGECKEKKDYKDYLLKIKNQNDSVGGIIEVKVKNVPIGLGEPYFSSLESEISRMIFSIPGIKGIEFGEGFQGVILLGSQFNDLIVGKNGETKTNHNGGINGGISNGNEIVFRVFIKPTNSIMKEQNSFHFGNNQIESLKVNGRHDVCFANRLEVVLKSCTNIVLTNLYLENECRK